MWASTACVSTGHTVLQGACHEPSERLLRNNRGASQEEGSPQWKYLQCIISAPHSLFDVESEAKPSAVWISDLYILSDGIQHDVAQADSTALLHVERSDVWVTGVSFVAASGSMNRAVLLKDGAMFLGGELPACMACMHVAPTGSCSA